MRAANGPGRNRTNTEGTFASPMTELVTGKTLPNVVVTGVAMSTALATDADATWKLLLDGQSGIRVLEDPFVDEFDLPVRIGGHLLHLDLVALRVQRADEVVPRVHAAADGEIASVAKLVASGEGRGNSPSGHPQAWRRAPRAPGRGTDPRRWPGAAYHRWAKHWPRGTGGRSSSTRST